MRRPRVLMHASSYALLCVCASACGGGGGGGGGGATPSSPPQPVLSGTLKVEGDPPPPRFEGAQSATRYRPGEVIVGVKPGAAIEAVIDAHPTLALEPLRALTDQGPFLLAVGSTGAEGKDRVAAAVAELQRDPQVRYAEPNYLVYSAARPNDPRYGDQWHYRLIGLEQAWEVTTGDPSIVVAVVDTGVRFDHPDLAPRLLPGYDFVSDLNNAGDGDGWDADATDPYVTAPSEPPSFHGTHVAGTIGAVTDNRQGVSGVTWRCPLLPVRVLGITNGGTAFDIASGIRWSAGLSVQGVPANPNPARVINLSLGSTVSTTVQKDAVDAALAVGAIVVAAAGNDGRYVASYPAAYPGVISVASINPWLDRASYSNSHDTVFIAAPGGELIPWSENGVLSTVADNASRRLTYTFLQGTSMASPHVAGVVALMLSANPSLSAADVQTILADTAFDLGPAGRDPEFGYGLIRADAAVRRAANTPPPPPEPAVEPERLVFESHVPKGSVLVYDLSGGALAVSGVQVDTFGSGTWLSAQALKSTTPTLVEVTIDRSGLAHGRYRGEVRIDTNAGTKRVEVIAEHYPVPDVGPITVELLDPATGQVVASTTTDVSKQYRYAFMPPLPPGDYDLVAYADRDGDGTPWSRIDEMIGFWPLPNAAAPIAISPNTAVTGADFPVLRWAELFDHEGAGAENVHGAMHLLVRDEESGLPLEGASVRIESLGQTLTTGRRGRLTVADAALQGPQTVTVWHTGYETKTYAGVNAAYLGFELAPLTSPSNQPSPVTLTVTVDGLDALDSVCMVTVINGGQTQTRTVTTNGAASIQLDFSVTPKLPTSIGASSYDASDDQRKLDLEFFERGELSGSTGVTLTVAPPPNGFKTITGNVTLPSGGVLDSANATTLPFYSFFTPDSFQGSFAIKPFQPPNLQVALPSFGQDVDARVPTLLVLFASDPNGNQSALTRFGFLSSLHTLSINDAFLDVPALTQPSPNAVVSGSPTFAFAPPSGVDFLELTVRNNQSGATWEFTLPGTTTSLTPPPIQGFFQTNTAFTWEVRGFAVDNFDYDALEFDLDLVVRVRAIVVAPARSFTVQ